MSVEDQYNYECTSHLAEKHMLPYIDECVRIVELIDKLRAEEGSTVTICCENPEGPPNQAVDVCGRWTNWLERRFTADTLAQALAAAVEAMEKPPCCPHCGGTEFGIPLPGTHGRPCVKCCGMESTK
jgi:hypothetical protein